MVRELSKLFVVRHAQVTVDFNIPPSDWSISVEGIQSARELSLQQSWGGVSRIYHSPENKAVATAKIISEVSGVPTKGEDDLRELRIPTIQPHDEFLRRVGEYFAGSNDPEFEDWNNATERIVSCVQRIVRNENGNSVAIVSHGRILTVLFSHILKRRMKVDEWQSIRMPDLSVIDLDSWTVERGFFST